MASEFIGYDVLVTLKQPVGGKLKGQVANVVGQNLLLNNVTLWNGQQLPTFSVDATMIDDLSLLQVTDQTAMQRQGSAQTVTTIPPAQVQPPLPQPTFVDPAILSYAKPPSNLINQSSQLNVGIHGTDRPTASATASLSEPFSNLELNAESKNDSLQSGPQDVEFQAAQNLTPAKQNARRNRHGNEGNFVPKHGVTASTNPKSKGWRQTAFVEPMGSAAQRSPEHQARQPTKFRKKKTRQSYADDASGWATEDATDIQELGEFDFQSNLSKFDKRRVFEEIRNDDTTADEARLVSFNRLPKPGTNGGKNLHWTENVLDSPQNSDTGDDLEHVSDARHSSENISGRERSRASARIQSSRKGSTIIGQPVMPQINVLGRSQLNISRTTSPHPGRSSVSPMVSANAAGASLRLTTTNRSCPTVSPLQTLEVEQIAVTEFGLIEEVITENAGRGIAEAAVSMLTSDAAAPNILLITGNHRTGARAISAARHLRNRGHRVTVCLLGQETELLENCRKQLDIFRKIGGRALKWEDVSTRLSTSDLSPDLVIDALFGMHLAFDDLRTDDQGVAFEMISWVNRSNKEILSVDIPSGMSASTGDITTVDGGRLCVNSSSVVCLGAPKTGVLNALLSGEGLSWSVTVADIGIPQIVWRKYGTRRRHGIDFGNRWLVPLRYQPPIA
ncbi:NAD(P)H-hydrate epimerase [Penicillium malachiteum]|uniref:NAD(P)H-hydrate epimerase n=1 Tax=Penicillium malachiteum TaxID=1324776 RepID=UPI002546F18B|nr:NAD(P)H-hydrate epimerase [Penicillium malachiteum]KAJ5713095.1 NAD(P)H-hydrate epimerase [Penicillium malachiteum]